MKKAPFLHSAPVKWLYHKASSMSMPGTKEVTLYAVLEFFIRKLNQSDINTRASALSFTFFLALFPTVIFFFTLIAYLPLSVSHDEILFFIKEAIPINVYETIRETLEDILKNQRGGLLSIGFFSAMYFSTNGFHSLMVQLNKFSHFPDTRPFWKQRLVAIGMAFFITFLILFSVLVLTTGTLVLSYLNKVKYFPSQIIPFLISSFTFLVVGIIVLGLVGAIYYFAPSRQRKWRFFSAGAVFATVVTLITTYGFSQYVNHFNSYNKVYGSIGVLIVIMMLIYINTFILLLGYELNVAIDLAINQERKNQARRTKVDNKIVFLDSLTEEEN
ncbi:MAG: YihY/virulence factor BrkB family protein [Bacteroidetes bacterium]|nr:YihY/virulence factor BrkB family protein [Bacteroidota bacterium]